MDQATLGLVVVFLGVVLMVALLKKATGLGWHQLLFEQPGGGSAQPTSAHVEKADVLGALQGFAAKLDAMAQRMEVLEKERVEARPPKVHPMAEGASDLHLMTQLLKLWRDEVGEQPNKATAEARRGWTEFAIEMNNPDWRPLAARDVGELTTAAVEEDVERMLGSSPKRSKVSQRTSDIRSAYRPRPKK
jgi:hypothetical protein